MIGSKTVLRSVNGLEQNTLDTLMYLFTKKMLNAKSRKLYPNNIIENFKLELIILLIFKINENTVYCLILALNRSKYKNMILLIDYSFI